MPTKKEAVLMLRASKHQKAADALDRWKNKDGQNLGWDAWFLSRDGYPELEDVVWPHGYKQ